LTFKFEYDKIDTMKLKELKNKYNSDEQLDIIYQTLEAVKEEYEDSEDIEDVFKRFFLIACACDDPSCSKWGIEGEIEGHVDDCPCKECKTLLA